MSRTINSMKKLVDHKLIQFVLQRVDNLLKD